MKRYLVLALAAFVLVAFAPSAFATRVIFDPPSPSPSGLGPPAGTDCTLSIDGLNNYTPCNISKTGVPYSVSFVDCTALTGLPSPAPGWCLYMDNVTGTSLNAFTFQFNVPAGGSYDGSDVLQCGSQPKGYATNNCPNGSSLSVNQLLDLSFFAPLANNTDFYLITDFINDPGYADVTVAATVPEPGEFGLFGLGLLLIGAGYGARRRGIWTKRRTKEGRG